MPFHPSHGNGFEWAMTSPRFSRPNVKLVRGETEVLPLDSGAFAGPQPREGQQGVVADQVRLLLGHVPKQFLGVLGCVEGSVETTDLVFDPVRWVLGDVSFRLHPGKEHPNVQQVFAAGVVCDLQLLQEEINVVALEVVGLQSAPLGLDEPRVRANFDHCPMAEGGVGVLELLPRIHKVPNERFRLLRRLVAKVSQEMVNSFLGGPPV